MINKSLALHLLLVCVLNLGAFAQTPATFDLDHKDPQSVVKAIFYAAKTYDLQILNCLCDPLGENDGDTKGICATGSLANEETRELEREEVADQLAEFRQYFAEGKITGPVQVKELNGISLAEVPFWFNHPGGSSRSNETMVLVKRYGNWYLSSF